MLYYFAQGDLLALWGSEHSVLDKPVCVLAFADGLFFQNKNGHKP